jgi:polyhydroxybutyrate depolymerase
MVWTLACQRPERFAAAAPLSSAMRESQLAACSPARPVPIVAMAGTADPVQRYDGWLGPPPLPRLLSVPETMEFWRRLHGCDGQAARWLPHREGDDPTRTELVEWTGCASGGPVLLYRVVGGGHQPPSFAPNTDEQRRRFGRRGQDVEAAEEIWRAFQRGRPADTR